MSVRDAIVTPFQGQPSAKSSSTSSSIVAPWQPTATEEASKFRISIEAVTHATSIPWSFPLDVGIVIAIMGSITGMGMYWPWGCPWRQEPPFGLASSPSSSWGTGFWKPLHCRMPPLQWLSSGRNELLSTVDIPVFLLPYGQMG